jgi:hypothetical protein
VQQVFAGRASGAIGAGASSGPPRAVPPGVVAFLQPLQHFHQMNHGKVQAAILFALNIKGPSNFGHFDRVPKIGFEIAKCFCVELLDISFRVTFRRRFTTGKVHDVAHCPPCFLLGESGNSPLIFRSPAARLQAGDIGLRAPQRCGNICPLVEISLKAKK